MKYFKIKIIEIKSCKLYEKTSSENFISTLIRNNEMKFYTFSCYAVYFSDIFILSFIIFP